MFAQLEPNAAPTLALPASPLVQAAFGHAAASTLKIEGIACSEIQEGSGFVVAPGIERDGTVIGVVFARSSLNDDIGYALTSTDVRTQTLRAETLDTPAPTGPCTAS